MSWYVYIGVALGVYILCSVNSNARFIAKLFCYYMTLITISIPVVICALFRPCHVDNISWAYPTCSLLTRVLGIRIELRGKDIIPKDKPCIIVSNHQTMMDALGISAFNLRSLTWLGRKENLFFYGPVGLAFWLCGGIHINRNNPESTRRTLADCVETLKEKSIKLWIFPEGGFADKSRLWNFKKGAFNMAVQAQIPIIPVVYSSFSNFFSEDEWRFNSGKLILQVLPPVSTEGLTHSDVPELTDRIRDSMKEVFKDLSTEAAQS